MAPAKLEILDILISISKLKDYFFISEFESIIFDGFMKIYGKEKTIVDIKVKKDDVLEYDEIIASQEYKKPPIHYDEGSLIKTLSPDNLNIGRPSTYASIIEKIQERNYVKKDDIAGIVKDKIILKLKEKKINEEKETINIGKEINKFISTDLGKIVNDFLVTNFAEIMEYEFTAEMEKKLDEIAEGKIAYKKVLKTFYDKFHPLVLELKDKIKEIKNENTRLLGQHPKTGFDIITTIARFGAVVKMCNPKDKKDCVYAPIKEPLTITNITLEDALKLLEYPKILGEYAGEKVKLSKGKYGFYIKFGKTNVSTGEREDVSLEEAIKMIEDKKKSILWSAEDKNAIYTVQEGKFGKYVKLKPKKGTRTINVKIPDDLDIKDLTIDKVYILLEKKKTRRRFKKKTI